MAATCVTCSMVRWVDAMASGCVIFRDGKLGRVWYVKYRDADGRQVKERVGSAAEGVTKRHAQAALRARLVDVERDGYRKPDPKTFESFASEWLATVPQARGLKASTIEGY